MDLILFIIVCISMTNIIQNESIFNKPRLYIYNNYPKLYGFIKCPVCFSFYVGLLLSFIFILHSNPIFNFFICGFISSIVNKTYFKLLPEDFGNI